MVIYVKDENLYSLLNSEESDRLDFKSADLLMNPDGKSRHTIAKHIVGFANHRGGKIVFGVSDDQEPEGKFLKGKESLGTISDIMDSVVNPPIDFSHTFYSSSQDDLSEGSVFVLEIPESSAAIPHAIVEKSEDKIYKREYRIRTGESTRLVSNEELLALFKEKPSSQVKSSRTIHYLLESDYVPADIKYKPNYQYSFERHFEELGDDENSLIDKIRSGYPKGSEKAGEKLVEAQYALTISSLLSQFRFKDIHETELVEKINNDIERLTFDLKSLEPSDIVLKNESNSLIKETELEKPGILPSYEPRFDNFKIPDSSHVQIHGDYEGFSIKNDSFRLVFSIDILEVGVGLPTRHPESVAEHAVYSHQGHDSTKATMYAHTNIESDFKYPNQKYIDYESYRSYCKSVSERFKNTYDWEGYIEQLPHDKVFQIEERIEDLHQKIEEMDNSV